MEHIVYVYAVLLINIWTIRQFAFNQLVLRIKSLNIIQEKACFFTIVITRHFLQIQTFTTCWPFSGKSLVCSISWPLVLLEFFPGLKGWFKQCSFMVVIMQIVLQHINPCGLFNAYPVMPGWVIPKTQTMVLDISMLNTQHYKVHFKGKGSNPGTGVAPSSTPHWSS